MIGALGCIGWTLVIARADDAPALRLISATILPIWTLLMAALSARLERERLLSLWTRDRRDAAQISFEDEGTEGEETSCATVRAGHYCPMHSRN